MIKKIWAFLTHPIVLPIYVVMIAIIFYRIGYEQGQYDLINSFLDSLKLKPWEELQPLPTPKVLPAIY
jgi:hypothetical protein